jgi:RNA polymerase sigma-70 factor (ECF subfamily)
LLLLTNAAFFCAARKNFETGETRLFVHVSLLTMTKSSLQTYSDADLYTLLRHEDTQSAAFSQLYDRYASRVYLYCRRILGDGVLADDLFQETFLKLLNCGREERPVSNVPAYLLRIARNLCLNARRRPSYSTVSLEELQLPIENYHPVESAELSRLVAMALELLHDEYREALALQVYGELSYQEIAEVLDVPVTTVRNRIVRAKKKVRDILAGYMEEMRG